MDVLNAVGSIGGIVALLAVVFFAGRYVSKFHDVAKIQADCPISSIAVKIDAIWGMKEDIAASIIKVDTLWRIYIEDNIVRHSNPGVPVVLPEELKGDIEKLLNKDNYLHGVKEPTLLVIGKIGVARFSQVAKANGATLGQVLVEVNNFVFSCLAGE